MGSSSKKHTTTKGSKSDGKKVSVSQVNPNEAYDPKTEGPETLTQEVVDARKEMRRQPTSDFADGSCDKMLLRTDTNPYTNEAPYSSSSKEKSSSSKKKKKK
ncbi:hypothetical protein LEL_01576 [Akanthomyces lecanii RCEF 1005]|uniref:Uncharacterized protein n=1 Tax=Akanthomyces lecanii RCEF 1005 TaxID=1081108 RepID=A0A168KR32_CORDF|nr:hypothetical protein LEL_01576 [Akanthomyces lecanii RCEF 1005]